MTPEQIAKKQAVAQAKADKQYDLSVLKAFFEFFTNTGRVYNVSGTNIENPECDQETSEKIDARRGEIERMKDALATRRDAQFGPPPNEGASWDVGNANAWGTDQPAPDQGNDSNDS